MAQEIERKFLINSDAWRADVSRTEKYRQGYLSDSPECSIRVRISDDHAYLNIKSATLGVQRTEYEYQVPLQDGEEMLASFCRKPVIVKTRYFVEYEDHVWEVNVFEGDNEGLIVAEIELDDEHEQFARPPWLGKEVSDDPRYYNVCLVEHPYKQWQD